MHHEFIRNMQKNIQIKVAVTTWKQLTRSNIYRIMIVFRLLAHIFCRIVPHLNLTLWLHIKQYACRTRILFYAHQEDLDFDTQSNAFFSRWAPKVHFSNWYLVAASVSIRWTGACLRAAASLCTRQQMHLHPLISCGRRNFLF